MTYREARAYLESVSQSGSVFGLDSIRNLLMELGNPQEDLKFVHIAGTNGKGSVLAYISTILGEAGYRTGRYVSPTVISHLECIQINQRNISEQEFATLVLQVRQASVRMQEKGNAHPTVFEMETAMAFLYFKEKACDIVVLETGLGGRDDATNVIRNTLTCVFTAIGRDHMEVLGGTLSAIASQKAGIIKPGSQVILGRQMIEAARVIKEVAKKHQCKLYTACMQDVAISSSDEIEPPADCRAAQMYYVSKADTPLAASTPMAHLSKNTEKRFVQSFSYKEMDGLRTRLLGRHQIENAIIAIEAVKALREYGFDISNMSIKKGLEQTKWLGRFTVVREHPVVIADGAHNKDAVQRLKETLIEYFPNQKVTCIMGVFKDKEVEAMLSEIAPVAKKIHTISLPNKERTVKAETLKQYIERAGIESEAHHSLLEALEQAIDEVGQEGVVVAFGSLSYMGQLFILQ